MRESHHGLVAKSGRLARGWIHLRKPSRVSRASALAKSERTIHFPLPRPSGFASPATTLPPPASVASFLSPAVSCAAPGPASVRRTPCASNRSLYGDARLATSLWGRSAVADGDFNLPQRANDLLRCVFLSSHAPVPSYQIFSHYLWYKKCR
jgi:hypothetical protein